MQTYRRLVRLLRDKCSAELPVKVRRTKLPADRDGDCWHKGEYYLIRIKNNLSEEMAIEVLFHEWAHVLAWHKCPRESHCNEWGKAYSKIYRIFLKNQL